MTRLILLALCLPMFAHAALRSGTGPTNPTPDVPPTSWQPPFSVLR